MRNKRRQVPNTPKASLTVMRLFIYQCEIWKRDIELCDALQQLCVCSCIQGQLNVQIQVFKRSVTFIGHQSMSQRILLEGKKQKW